MEDHFSKSINSLKEKNIYRSLTNCDVIDAVTIKKSSKKYISFCSNDYLGLSQNLEVKKAAIDAINKYGAGAGASRYVSGNNSLYVKLEKEIARVKNSDDAIVFSSGYQAAIGVIPALVDENDLVVADKLIHSCLLDGVKLSGAKLMRFKHNDIKHCEEIILNNTKKYQKILIITESIFSMDGDAGRVAELGEIAQKYGCMFLTDGAHDLYGEGSVGAGSSRPLHSRQGKISLETRAGQPRPYGDFMWVKMGTLSKAIGSFGGFVASDKITIDYLRNFAKSAIYTTALPPAVLAASLQSLKIITAKNPAAKTLKNVEYFCQLMNLPKPESAIVVIIIGDNKKVLEIAKNVEQKGFLISAIRPPTVEPKGARLRITFSSAHTKSQIKKLVEVLKKIL